ncbi:hypothetical protein J6590_077139 [Homalodisca vitripennis]|nr:hypothetical protein J6590_077139 [Homalodisca vitripennis]
MPGGKQGWSGAVYLSARLKHALSNSRRIDMDVTFKVLPVQLGTRLQLLTVHAEYLNYKNAAGVRGVLQYLMQLVQQWQPEIVLADFETAIRNAARLVWPHARIVGCFFHYAQAIFRMRSTLQLWPLIACNLKAGKVLCMLIALCLLPADRIQTGLRITRHYL